MATEYKGGLCGIWKKKYTIRMYRKAEFVEGNAICEEYEEKEVQLDVQPSSSNIQHTPQGDRETKTLTSYGNFPVQTASAIQGYRADMLWYDGEWYECSSCQWYEHLPIKHWTATWTRLSESFKELAPGEKMEAEDDDWGT